MAFRMPPLSRKLAILQRAGPLFWSFSGGYKIEALIEKRHHRKMTSSSQLVAGTALALCGIAVVPALIATLLVLHDINSFQSEVYEDLEEFKSVADDAWVTMVPRDDAVQRLETLIRRFRRGYGDADGSCNCGLRPTNCPPGPPGQPGTPGLPGDDGLDGRAGNPGRDSTEGEQTADFKKEVQCPAGPPGPPGPDGFPGHPGPDGEYGDDGQNGKDGDQGPDGPEGDAGTPGLPGPPGEDGEKGQNGTRGQGQPGPVGAPGAPGEAGRDGDAGQNGQDGQEGPEGPAGPDGQPGHAGPDGPAGPSGAVGAPGDDAAYCSCPPRTAELAVTGIAADAAPYDTSAQTAPHQPPNAPPKLQAPVDATHNGAPAAQPHKRRTAARVHMV